MWESQTNSQQLGDLEARVADLQAQLQTALGILAILRPAATALSRSGVPPERQEEFFSLIDQFTRRVDSGVSVSFSEFEDRVLDIVPERRGDRRFFESLIEALKLERPSAKPMLDYLTHAMALFRA